MDILCKKLLLFAAAMVFGLPVMAQEKVSKKTSESYEFTNDGKLHLDNKYGNITIHGWTKNEVSITVTITVTHKKRGNAQELLNRIHPILSNSEKFISVSYEIRENTDGFFSNLFQKANPLTFGRGNVQIDYNVFMPEKAELEIVNKFGDVFIEDWRGMLKANVQHGDIYINDNLNKANVSLKYGKLKAKNINYGNLELKNGGLDMDDSKTMRLNSSGSEIDMRTVGSLECYSNKDKVALEEVNTFYGTLKFSNIHLRRLTKDIDLILKISDFDIEKIVNSSANIAIEQESSEVNLNISDFPHEFSAVLVEGLVRLPKTFYNVDSKILDKGDKVRVIEATYGKSPLGRISITGTKGVVLLKEL